MRSLGIYVRSREEQAAFHSRKKREEKELMAKLQAEIDTYVDVSVSEYEHIIYGEDEWLWV